MRGWVRLTRPSRVLNSSCWSPGKAETSATSRCVGAAKRGRAWLAGQETEDGESALAHPPDAANKPVTVRSTNVRRGIAGPPLERGPHPHRVLAHTVLPRL